MTLTPGDLPTTAIVNNAAAVALPARVRESLTAQANMAAGQAKLDRNNEARYQEQANAHRASAESLEAQAAEIRDYLAHHPDTAPDPEPAPAHTGGSSGASFVQ